MRRLQHSPPTQPRGRPHIRIKPMFNQSTSNSSRTPKPTPKDKNYPEDTPLKQAELMASKAYQELFSKFKTFALREEEELERLKERKAKCIKASDDLKKEQTTQRMEIWYLRNQIMQIDEQISQQNEQGARLEQQLQFYVQRNAQQRAPQ